MAEIILILLGVGGLVALLIVVLRRIRLNRWYRRSEWCQISPRCILTRGHSGECDWV